MHYILIMFNNDDTISYVCKSLEVLDQHFIITGMESDRWLVENIDNPLKSCTNLGGKTDTLRFSS